MSSRYSDDNKETLSTILSTLKDLKSDISSCTTTIANLENNYTSNGDSGSLQEDQDLETLERESDTISVLAGNDFDRSNWDQQDDLALQPPVSAIQPSNPTIQPPNPATQPPNPAIKRSNSAC
ncbi:Hypothetical predicted protein [Paramuricea clavata]|uniref:Uncharacterized protein n=1 Tax=Paramuricea clavata TaxID=317549 RepID=A0A7D9KFK4_PARCT|nr:Hypothetical predicted protein [Paramuricea clavata]